MHRGALCDHYPIEKSNLKRLHLTLLYSAAGPSPSVFQPGVPQLLKDIRQRVHTHLLSFSLLFLSLGGIRICSSPLDEQNAARASAAAASIDVCGGQ